MSDLEQFPNKDLAVTLAYYVKKVFRGQGRMALSVLIHSEPSPGKKSREKLLSSSIGLFVLITNNTATFKRFFFLIFIILICL